MSSFILSISQAVYESDVQLSGSQSCTSAPPERDVRWVKYYCDPLCMSTFYSVILTEEFDETK